MSVVLNWALISEGSFFCNMATRKYSFQKQCPGCSKYACIVNLRYFSYLKDRSIPIVSAKEEILATTKSKEKLHQCKNVPKCRQLSAIGRHLNLLH